MIWACSSFTLVRFWLCLFKWDISSIWFRAAWARSNLTQYLNCKWKHHRQARKEQYTLALNCMIDPFNTVILASSLYFPSFYCEKFSAFEQSARDLCFPCKHTRHGSRFHMSKPHSKLTDKLSRIEGIPGSFKQGLRDEVKTFHLDKASTLLLRVVGGWMAHVHLGGSK